MLHALGCFWSQKVSWHFPFFLRRTANVQQACILFSSSPNSTSLILEKAVVINTIYKVHTYYEHSCNWYCCIHKDCEGKHIGTFRNNYMLNTKMLLALLYNGVFYALTIHVCPLYHNLRILFNHHLFILTFTQLYLIKVNYTEKEYRL